MTAKSFFPLDYSTCLYHLFALVHVHQCKQTTPLLLSQHHYMNVFEVSSVSKNIDLNKADKCKFGFVQKQCENKAMVSKQLWHCRENVMMYISI